MTWCRSIAFDTTVVPRGDDTSRRDNDCTSAHLFNTAEWIMTADFHYPADRSPRANTPPSLLRPSWQRTPTPTPKPLADTAVVTVLTPHERTRVDAAGEGCYTALHRDSLEEALHDLRLCRAQAVLVSVARCNARAASSVARLVREFPAVQAVAIWCESNADSAHAVLALGQQGVQSLVDVRDPSGWRTLRQLFSSHRGDSIERRAVAQLAELLAVAPEDCRRFLDACFTAPARVGTVRQLAKRLGVSASTLMSRFYRAGLPAPKRYLSLARLVRAAALFENPGLSITQVSNTLEYSSPQSFGRHIHTMLGVSAVTFRREFDGLRMLDRFVDDLITPYLHTLRTFTPLVVLPTYARLATSSQEEHRLTQSSHRPNHARRPGDERNPLIRNSGDQRIPPTGRSLPTS